jgi:ketosteroid isomerase-like protein
MLVTGADGAQLGLIPTLIALSAKKFFGNKNDDPDALGDHPAVAYIFKALTTGEMDEVEEMVAADFHAYANGYEVVHPAGADGAEQFRQNIEYWRSTVPNLSVDLYDEVSQKEPDKTDSIAVRYVISGSLPMEDDEMPFTAEVATFIKVVDHKITEWRVVVDQTFLEEVRAAMGIPIDGEV